MSPRSQGILAVPFGEPVIQDEAPPIPASDTAWSIVGAQIRQHYGGMPVLAGGLQDGQTHVAFSDALPPEGQPAGLDVESKCSAISKGDEEASGYYRLETEPSEVQDQPAIATGTFHAGHQSDGEAPQDGNQSTNSRQSKELATCEQVVKS